MSYLVAIIFNIVGIVMFRTDKFMATVFWVLAAIYWLAGCIYWRDKNENTNKNSNPNGHIHCRCGNDDDLVK